MPLCWCSTLYKTTVHIVSGPEECRKLEERFRSETSDELAVCYYEEWC